MKVLEDPPLEVKRKLPKWLDALLYPASISGMIHILIFLLVPLMTRLLPLFLIAFPVNLLYIAFYLSLIGYVIYYLSECVGESAKGGFRAPVITMQTYSLDKWDCLGQIFLLFGCAAICLWPPAVYYILTERADIAFWILTVVFGFFLPMSLLTGVMFESIDALNPLLIIKSIANNFWPYCGLVLRCFGLCALLVGWNFLPLWLPLPAFLFYSLCMYVAIVISGLLGSFYWWHKDKFDWGF